MQRPCPRICSSVRCSRLALWSRPRRGNKWFISYAGPGATDQSQAAESLLRVAPCSSPVRLGLFKKRLWNSKHGVLWVRPANWPHSVCERQKQEAEEGRSKTHPGTEPRFSTGKYGILQRYPIGPLTSVGHRRLQLRLFRACSPGAGARVTHHACRSLSVTVAELDPTRQLGLSPLVVALR